MATGFKAYPFDVIEPKWQSFWVTNKTFRTPQPTELGGNKPKYYVLDMFPYPSGSGLHVGHLEGYTATDIIARYKRMRGYNVLHPIGWDAFGLPAEQHAVETGTHPRTTTQKNIDNFRRQIQEIGFSYDWDREINTTDPDYVRWTQWIFMKLFERGLAYEAEVAVNWCPELGTVLANEEVINGKSERGNHPVIRKPMRQWVLKITAYAERLLADLDLLDWPEPIKEQQRNWIGRSEGALVDFSLPGSAEKIQVFTTRPDTLFGATYMVLAPEHALVMSLTTAKQKQVVEEYRVISSRKSDLDRTDLAKEKTGVFTGAYAINPVNDKKIPIWIADYVLISYGTGAIMAVPAHDERDFEFAETYGLAILPVIVDPKGEAFQSASTTQSDRVTHVYTGTGVCCHSQTPDASFSINGLSGDAAKTKITDWLLKNGVGQKSIQYKLRDWLFSRQRYWGEPIPVIHVDGKPKLIAETELPLRLPEVERYKPTGTGDSPLAAVTDWVQTTDGMSGKKALRETNTMPQWAGSCWYYLRYIDPRNSQALVDSALEKHWMNVDLYVGGAEHAVLHLLYARFWHKVLFDLGLVSTVEPFQKLVNQGMILGEDGQKMSKSRGNVVNQDELVKGFGADSVRLYEMFMGPLEMSKPWSNHGVEGVHRFLARVWRLFIHRALGDEVSQAETLQASIEDRPMNPAELKRLHTVIKKVTEDIEGIRLNTAIAALMIFLNETLKAESHSRVMLEAFILLLAPFAPHMAEELWHRLGHNDTLAFEPWPSYDETVLIEDNIELAVMVQGKVRAKVVVSREAGRDEVQALALADPAVKKWIDGKPLKQVVVVPGRMVNIVLAG